MLRTVASVDLVTRTLRFDRGGIQAPGCGAVRFTYPRIAASFSSPLLNDRNYELSGGGPWRDVLGQVTGARKPVCFLDSAEPKNRAEYPGVLEPSPDPMRDAARIALDAGCCVLLYMAMSDEDDEGDEVTTFCSASISGRIRDVFDLDALIADYRAYTAAAGPDAVDDIASELRSVGSADVSDFLDFGVLEGDWDVVARPADWARRGLLFGYPVDSTAALICETLEIPGCGSSYVD